MCAMAMVGIGLLSVGIPYARAIRKGQVAAQVAQAVTNEHLATINGTVARHEDLISDNAQRIADTIGRIEACRQRQEDRAQREMAEFRAAVQEDIQSALDRWNTKHHEGTG